MCEMAGVTPVCVVCEMMDSKTGQATSVADAKKNTLKKMVWSYLKGKTL